MKIIFLDFDGVLNSAEWWFDLIKKQPELTGTQLTLDPRAVLRLQKLVDRTGAKVVISSSWRVGRSLETLRKVLRDMGFTGEVLDKTGTEGRRRDTQILGWLSAHPEVTKFIALDDSIGDMTILGNLLVRTDAARGLQDADVERAVELLEECPRSLKDRHLATNQEA